MVRKCSAGRLNPPATRHRPEHDPASLTPLPSSPYNAQTKPSGAYPLSDPSNVQPPTSNLQPPASVIVIGAGLAGTEAAWQAAQRGLHVVLYEMRPQRRTPAHETDQMAELVCSNSLGSSLPDRALGLLKSELRRMGSLNIACADATAVPAGDALAVDREAFSRAVTAAIEGHPNIEVRREEVTDLALLPSSQGAGVRVIATGPLTSQPLAEAHPHAGRAGPSLLLRCHGAHRDGREHRYEHRVARESVEQISKSANQQISKSANGRIGESAGRRWGDGWSRLVHRPSPLATTSTAR